MDRRLGLDEAAKRKSLFLLRIKLGFSNRVASQFIVGPTSAHHICGFGSSQKRKTRIKYVNEVVNY
jgi:hypothetical protein